MADVIAAVPPTVGGGEVITLVLDDGSRDATAAVAGQAGALVTAVEDEGGLGRPSGRGWPSVAGWAPPPWCSWTPTVSTTPASWPRSSPVLDGEADYVIGSRFTGRIEVMRRHRRAGNRVLTRWVRWVVRERVTDGQSGYRAVRRGRTVRRGRP